jgi:hypothetical protein
MFSNKRGEDLNRLQANFRQEFAMSVITLRFVQAPGCRGE